MAGESPLELGARQYYYCLPETAAAFKSPIKYDIITVDLRRAPESLLYRQTPATGCAGHDRHACFMVAEFIQFAPSLHYPTPTPSLHYTFSPRPQKRTVRRHAANAFFAYIVIRVAHARLPRTWYTASCRGIR